MSLSSQLTTLAQNLADILDAINTKLAVKSVVSSADTLGEVPEKIGAIPQEGGGVVPTGNIAITQNTSGASTLDIAQYATATVNVPTGTARSSSDVTVSGKTVTVPAGLYSSQVQKSVTEKAQATPEIYVNSSTGKVTSISTQETGYVTGGEKSAEFQLPTQAAQTIHPSRNPQTISPGVYLTGTQTIQGVQTTNLVPGYIKSGVTVKIGDSSDDDCVTSVTGTYGGVSSNMVFGYDYVTAYRTGDGMLTFSNLPKQSGTTNIGVWITRNASDAGSDDGYIGTLLANLVGGFTVAIYSHETNGGYVLKPDTLSAIHLTLSSNGTSGSVSIDTTQITGFGSCAYRVYPIYIEE